MKTRKLEQNATEELVLSLLKIGAGALICFGLCDFFFAFRDYLSITGDYITQLDSNQVSVLNSIQIPDYLTERFKNGIGFVFITFCIPFIFTLIEFLDLLFNLPSLIKSLKSERRCKKEKLTEPKTFDYLPIPLGIYKCTKEFEICDLKEGKPDPEGHIGLKIVEGYIVEADHYEAFGVVSLKGEHFEKLCLTETDGFFSSHFDPVN